MTDFFKALWLIALFCIIVVLGLGWLSPSQPVLPAEMSDNFISDNWLHTPHPGWIGIWLVVASVTCLLFFWRKKETKA